MSASDKKRLRKEENLAALTEKQHKEKAEAKKLKIATIAFVAVLAVMVVVAAVVMSVNIINNTGVIDKNTIAATVAALVIIPACFAYNLDVGAGPALLAIYLFLKAVRTRAAISSAVRCI